MSSYRVFTGLGGKRETLRRAEEQAGKVEESWTWTAAEIKKGKREQRRGEHEEEDDTEHY